MSNTVAREARHTVEINNIGTIQSLVFDLPDDSGGVLVLKGRNKIGKSTAIRVLRALLSGNGRGLPVRDKAVRGSAEAFGKRASVTNQVRLTGDLNVESLEGKFDFSDLVHPEAEQPETRDRIRIKALLSLTGVAADPAIFYDLVGGQAEFEKLIPAESIKKKDLVELAGMIHRALHARAKEKESEAQFANGHAQACREAAGGEAVNGEVDLVALHAASNTAAAELSTVQERIKQAEETRQRIETVELAIESAQKNHSDQPDVALAKKFRDEARIISGEAAATVVGLQQQLETAKQALKDANAETRRCEDALAVAEQYESGIANLNAMLQQDQQSLASAPTTNQEEFALAKANLHRSALERGIKLRDAQMKLVEASGHQETADKAAQEATRLREAARSVDQVLSQKLPDGPLRAEAGRLVLDTERGEGAPFDECSDGEAWEVALPYGIKAVGKGGVLAVVQDAWQDLDQEARQRIAAAAKSGLVWLLTAEVADGDLRAEVFQPEPADAQA